MTDAFGTLVVEGPPLWRVVFWVGAMLWVAALLWLAVRAFEESVAWGIAILLFPVIGLVFIVKHWDKARGAVGAWVVAVLLVLVPQPFKEVPGAEPAGAEYQVYGNGPVYQYTDDRGRAHVVGTLDAVPTRYLESVERLEPEPRPE